MAGSEHPKPSGRGLQANARGVQARHAARPALLDNHVGGRNADSGGHVSIADIGAATRFALHQQGAGSAAHSILRDVHLPGVFSALESANVYQRR